MTTTNDPTDAGYLDEFDVRQELTRAFDVCQSCRHCVGRCASFPTLFDMIDRHGDGDAGRLTPAEQDRVVDECHLCTLCALDCPYAPGRHELAVDVPRLMVRARAMQLAHGHTPAIERRATRLLGAFTAGGSIAGALVGGEPGSTRRTTVAASAGVSAVRLLPPRAKERFSTWFDRRDAGALTEPRDDVTLFAGCDVEFRAPEIGRDLVRVYERNGIRCERAAGGCCGAVWLHSGDVGRFTEAARRTVDTLVRDVRAGRDVVVAQPTCSHVITQDYPVHLGDPDAQLVAEHTHDASAYLMRMHADPEAPLDTDFTGETVESITYHAACRLRARPAGAASRELLELTGARVEVVEQCAGIGSTWGYRASNEAIAVPVAERLGTAVDRAGGDVVAGDCHLANTTIAEQTDRIARHPLQVLARAYGVDDD